MLALIRTIAIADALGAPYEFADAGRRAKYDGTMGLGVYTDDTQMTVAIAEHMLLDGRKSQESYAEFFIEAYRRDPRAGYSKRTRAALESPSPSRMLEKGVFGPRGNGSVMRCLPLGLYADPSEVVGRALVQSTATHLSLAAANASALTALAAHYVYHRWESRRGLLDFLVSHLGEGVVRHVLKDGKVDGEIGNDAVHTASWCVRTAANILEMDSVTDTGAESACRLAVMTGGDVDSMCAVASGIISLKAGYRYEFAKHEKSMAAEPYGIEYLTQLDQKLFDRFPRS